MCAVVVIIVIVVNMSDRELSCSNSGGGVSSAGQFMDRGRMNQNGVVQPLLTGKFQANVYMRRVHTMYVYKYFVI